MPPTRLRPWLRRSHIVLASGVVAAGLLTAVTSPAASASPAVTWSTLNTAVSPPGLSGAVAAFDADSGRLVVFGGVTASGALSGTTWLWDGTSWSEAQSNAAQPPPRRLASMAFDPDRHQLILFGGMGAHGGLLGDTWAWNGASWYELSKAATGGPSPRAAAALGYDTSHNLVLFGGMGAPDAATTSAYSTSPTSVQTTTLPGPPPTRVSTTRSAPSTSTTTAVPSRPPSSHTPSSQPPSSQPAPRQPAPSLPASSQPPSSQPAPRQPPSSQPAPRQPARVDPGSGPATLGDTWIWNGSRWMQEHPTASPPARAGADVASDTVGHELTLFGGSATPFIGPGASAFPLGDTWEWLDGTWVPRAPAASPAPRYEGIFSYDTDIGASVLYGGSGASATLGDTWAWNGMTWSPVAAAASPAPRSRAAGQFDNASRQLVVFGGADAVGNPLDDTAVLTSTAPVELNPSQSGGAPSGPSTSTSGAVAPPLTTTPGARMSTSPGSRTSGSTSTTSNGPSARGVRPGDVVILGGGGFRGGATIVITFHSTPVPVGSVFARPNGTFSATVTVPAGAKAGGHAFEAAGPNPEGRTISVWTAVQVQGLASSGRTSLSVKLAMVGIAIGIPVVAWLALSARSSFRRGRIVRH